MAALEDKKPETASIKIKLGMAGMGSIEVDGVNLAKYSRSVEFKAAAGELNECIINLCGITEIEADAVLVIKKYADADMESGFIKGR
jgi:hypothetical protein